MIRYRLNRVGSRIMIEDGGIVLYVVHLCRGNVHVYDAKGDEKAFLETGSGSRMVVVDGCGEKDLNIVFPNVGTLRTDRPLYAETRTNDGMVEVKSDKDGGIFLLEDTVIGSIKSLYAIRSVLSMDEDRTSLLPVLLALAYALRLCEGVAVV